MWKLLPLGVVVVMLGLLLYLRFHRESASPNLRGQTNTSGQSTLLPSLETSPPDNLGDRLLAVEESISLLAKRVTNTAPASAPSSSDNRVKALEDSVASLQKELDQLKTTPAPTQTTFKSLPIYIPLGSGSSSTSQDWSLIEGYQVSLDPGDYPGYSGIQLEVTAKLAQAAGTGYVRLYNATDNSAVSSSDASTTAASYALATSGGFKLALGRKTYQLQLKTSQGFEFYIQTARLKVSF